MIGLYVLNVPHAKNTTYRVAHLRIESSLNGTD